MTGTLEAFICGWVGGITDETIQQPQVVFHRYILSKSVAEWIFTIAHYFSFQFGFCELWILRVCADVIFFVHILCNHAPIAPHKMPALTKVKKIRVCVWEA